MVWDTNEETGSQSIRDVKEQEVFFGEIPLMTENGTFIINGTERVVVSQLHRSPGVFYDHDKGKTHSSGKLLYSARVIPYRGSWLDFEFDPKDLLYVRIDRRRKLHATVLLRALGYSTEELLNYYYDTETRLPRAGQKYAKSRRVRPAPRPARHPRHPPPGTREILVKKNRKFTKLAIKKLQEHERRPPAGRGRRAGRQGGRARRHRREPPARSSSSATRRSPRPSSTSCAITASSQFKVLFIDDLNVGSYLRDTLIADKLQTPDEAIMEIYRRLRPGDPPTPETAHNLFNNLFFNPERYDLSKVGRLKLNYKFKLDEALTTRVLTKRDILETVRYLIDLKNGKGQIDDIDHLGNRRVRAVGELMENQYRIGLVRMERAIKERMSMSQEIETLMPHDLINAKPVSAVVKEYFGSSQLSQFMDQTNPLSEVTHKRRLSALGPGGLTRERAGFEVRDVHADPLRPHLPDRDAGRSEHRPHRVAVDLCARERVRLHRDPVPQGRATGSVDRRGRVLLGAPGGGALHRPVEHRPRQEGQVHRRARLVPPQRRVRDGQAGRGHVDGRLAEPARLGRRLADPVPRERRREPRAHGFEHAAPGGAAHPHRCAARRHRASRASSPATRASPWSPAATAWSSRSTPPASSSAPTAETDDRCRPSPTSTTWSSSSARTRTPASTRSRSSSAGDTCKAGDVIADGPATEQGELALGQNVLVAFMPWGATTSRTRSSSPSAWSRTTIFTSIHIEEFECVARDTKLGKEEITRDIPNVGEEALKDLDESGIVRIGAEVKPGDILVGKITPKGETQLSPEEKLLRAIFGEKAGDVRDTSLRVPPGVQGIVIGAKVFSRKGTEKDERAKDIEDQEKEQLLADQRDEMRDHLRARTHAKMRKLLARQDHRGAPGRRQGQGPCAKGEKIDDRIARRDPAASTGREVQVEGDRPRTSSQQLAAQLEETSQAIDAIYKDKIAKLTKGDELPPGVIKMVKVYVAIKRKLSVGDKMAGRHGNKGVVSRILPDEDMPYLEDGTPVDIVLNPLGVPSRMNVGQILETPPRVGRARSSAADRRTCSSRSTTRTTLRERAQEDLHRAKHHQKLLDELDDEDDARVVAAQAAAKGVHFATPGVRRRQGRRIKAALQMAGLPPTGSRRSSTAAPARRSSTTSPSASCTC